MAKLRGDKPKRDIADAADEEPLLKKVKQKEVYGLFRFYHCFIFHSMITVGVDQRKFYEVNKSAEAVDAITKVHDEFDFMKREEVFSKHRRALQQQFRLNRS